MSEAHIRIMRRALEAIADLESRDTPLLTGCDRDAYLLGFAVGRAQVALALTTSEVVA